MTVRELQGAFQLEINNYDQPGILTSDTIFYWLNKALQQYVEMKYSNDKESFEQTQKITDVLKNLVTRSSIITVDTATPWGPGAVADLPIDYMHLLNDRVEITFTNPLGDQVTQYENITESDRNTINKQLADPYSPHRLHYEHAKPLRLMDVDGDKVWLVTDTNYKVSAYELEYLRIPTVLELDPTDVDKDFTDLPDYVHQDFVTLAAMLYLRSIGAGVPPKQAEQAQPTKQ